MSTVAAPEDRSILVVAFSAKVFGLDRQTGAVRWRTEIEAYRDIEIAVWAGWVIACSNSHLYFIEYATGRLATSVKHAFKGLGRPTMLIDGGQIIVGAAGEVTAYSIHGQPLWAESFKGQGVSSVTLAFPGNARQADDVS